VEFSVVLLARAEPGEVAEKGGPPATLENHKGAAPLDTFTLRFFDWSELIGPMRHPPSTACIKGLGSFAVNAPVVPLCCTTAAFIKEGFAGACANSAEGTTRKNKRTVLFIASSPVAFFAAGVFFHLAQTILRTVKDAKYQSEEKGEPEYASCPLCSAIF
jgi:hypothetical protein